MRMVSIAALLLLAGCQKSFDQRYSDAEKKIREQAASIDKDLNDRASEPTVAPVVARPNSSRQEHAHRP